MAAKLSLREAFDELRTLRHDLLTVRRDARPKGLWDAGKERRVRALATALDSLQFESFAGHPDEFIEDDWEHD